jgi:hypothetical protein
MAIDTQPTLPGAGGHYALVTPGRQAPRCTKIGHMGHMKAWRLTSIENSARSRGSQNAEARVFEHFHVSEISSHVICLERGWRPAPAETWTESTTLRNAARY